MHPQILQQREDESGDGDETRVQLRARDEGPRLIFQLSTKLVHAFVPFLLRFLGLGSRSVGGNECSLYGFLGVKKALLVPTVIRVDEVE